MNLKYVCICITCALIFLGCSKETVAPELFGSVDGSVINSETNEGIANVNITTTPATNSILTENDGSFQLEDVPTGNYTITANKPGLDTETVSVNVRENRTASAVIYLNSESGTDNLQATVIGWQEVVEGDSTFAEVDYEVENTSSDQAINEYEIYFTIVTSGNNFSQEERDTTLAPNEKDIGEFRKYIVDNTIDSVIVSGSWTSDQ